ncbi:Uncharacterised protein [[Eubacterium] infirmum]|nr:Uncharacterised protein [[Eubacterium] infirmum]
MDSFKKLMKMNLPLIIGLITALVVIYKGENNIMTNYIGLIIALITVAGSILANFFQYRKDSNTIGTVKSDTSNMLPKVDTINENTKEINKYIVDDVKGSLQDIINIGNKIHENNVDIKLIADDVKFRQRLSSEYKGVTTRDTLISGIDEVYTNNSVLQEIIKEKDKSILELSRSIKSMKQENELLNKENINLKSQIRKLEEEKEQTNEKEDDFEL